MFIKDFIPYDLGFWQWAALCVSAVLIGLSKTGVNGASAAIIPVLALIFGAKESTGVMLPMLCFADILAVAYYRRSGEWKHILRLLPWAIAGFAAALFVDSLVPAGQFKILLGICILSGLAVMLWNDLRPKFLRAAPHPAGNVNSETGPEEKESPRRRFGFVTQAFFGVAGGFSTMIANAAGPVMSVYLLTMRLPKTSFVGTAAWFFMIINYLKMPLQILVWHNITLSGLKLGLVLSPVIVAGAALGVFLVKKVSESHYRVLVYIMTIISTALLFVQF